jgi:hypothetical protein
MSISWRRFRTRTPLRGLAIAPEPTEICWEGRQATWRRVAAGRAEYTDAHRRRKDQPGVPLSQSPVPASGGVQSYSSPMRAGGIALGLMAAIAGFIWIAQGLNLSFAPRSFMTSDRTWVLIGVVALVGGVAFARWSWRRS